ncbi:MAG: hypothetical protein HOF95_02150, partial [Rhodospirillales bacterium]|nr:hypothetical protein [Rhodospirillales bacterium]
MSYPRFSILLSGAALGVTLGFGTQMAPAVAADMSLKGETVQIIINSRPGGGTDANARRIGGYLIHHLP